MVSILFYLLSYKKVAPPLMKVLKNLVEKASTGIKKIHNFTPIFQKVQNSCVQQKEKNFTEKLMFKGAQAWDIRL